MIQFSTDFTFFLGAPQRYQEVGFPRNRASLRWGKVSLLDGNASLLRGKVSVISGKGGFLRGKKISPFFA